MGRPIHPSLPDNFPGLSTKTPMSGTNQDSWPLMYWYFSQGGTKIITVVVDCVNVSKLLFLSETSLSPLPGTWRFPTMIFTIYLKKHLLGELSFVPYKHKKTL